MLLAALHAASHPRAALHHGTSSRLKLAEGIVCGSCRNLNQRTAAPCFSPHFRVRHHVVKTAQQQQLLPDPRECQRATHRDFSCNMNWRANQAQPEQRGGKVGAAFTTKWGLHADVGALRLEAEADENIG